MMKRSSLLIALGAGALATAAALVDCSRDLSSAPGKQEEALPRPEPRPAPTPQPTPAPAPTPRPTVPAPGPTDTGDPGPPSVPR